MTKRHVRWGGLLNLCALALICGAALPACGASAGGATTTTTVDGGTDRSPSTPPANTGGCPTLCAHLRAAACGSFNEQCVAACQQLSARFPGCGAQFNAYVTCGASAPITCAEDGPEIGGCDTQAAALGLCGGPEPEPTADGGVQPNADRCLPDTSIPADIAATICTGVPSRPVPHDCPGGAPSDDCVPSPGGKANVFCCVR